MEWIHLAFVYDYTPVSEGITLYKNGEQVGFRAGSMGGTNRSFSSLLRFGIICCNTGTGRAFNGLIDEIRVWYDARTQAEIRENMCQKLTGTEPNLTLYYRLDQIVNDTVYDLTPNNNHGVLNSVNAATHLVTSGAAVGDLSVYTYPASWAGQDLYLQGADNESLRVNNVTSNPGGVHIYHVNELPNTINGINGLGGNDHYYGVFVANDNTSTYDATYYYGNNTAFQNSDPSIFNETDLALFTRADNADDP